MDANPLAEESAVLRHLQIVFAALMLGSLIFGLFAFFAGGLLQTQPAGAPPTTPGQPAAGAMPLSAILRLLWGALAAGELLAFPFVRRSALKLLVEEPPADEQADRAALVQSFSQLSIIAGALAEGAAFFGGVILLLAGGPLDFLLVALPLLALVIMFPTPGKWQAFAAKIRNERALRPE